MPTTDFDPTKGVFFLWGDTDYDPYGPRGPYKDKALQQKYIFNQIVPQAVVGNVLDQVRRLLYGCFCRKRLSWLQPATAVLNALIAQWLTSPFDFAGQRIHWLQTRLGYLQDVVRSSSILLGSRAGKRYDGLRSVRRGETCFCVCCS